MKNFLFWLTRILGMSLIVFQISRYFLGDGFSWETFKGKSILYDISYLVAFNLSLIAGVILIFVSYKIRKRNYAARE